MLQNTEVNLSEDELKLLEEYRSGRFNKNQDRVIVAEDLELLNQADAQVKNLVLELGLLEERKAYIIEALQSSRKQKNSLLQEVMLKYGIPANQPFKINRETGVVEFDLHDQDFAQA